MRLDGDRWQSYTSDFKRSAFRLEVHPVYTMPGEVDSLRAFLAGDPMPEGFNAEWHQKIRAHVDAGRTMQRAKVVRRPFTDYTEYLFEWCIPGNVAAGEDYRIIDLSSSENPGLPDQDFWFFDDSTVVDLNYRPDGTQIGRELIEDPDLDTYRHWRDLALSVGVPFGEYKAT